MAKYTARVDALVPEELRRRVAAVVELPACRSAGVRLSDIIREAIMAGLPVVEATWRGEPAVLAFVPPAVPRK